ncbi:MAG: GNAT family N-acetyltransferase [Robiginitomaculum sp.]|nr:MAG: GNAT family N-acetyltransferase [Robiginitomaculum sp.]
MTDLANYHPRPLPGQSVLSGKSVRLEPINWDRHGAKLAQHIIGPNNARLWTHIPIGPFDDLAALQTIMGLSVERGKWEVLAIIRTRDESVVGTASYMRIRPEHGSAEIGCVVFSQGLQRTIEATEAMYLLAAHVFDDLGYRRYEWKCDNSNTASKRAAERFGFTFEGIFRNDMVMKQKNRDTAWFAMTDADWPLVKSGFETWLSAQNFDTDGVQKRSLSACRQA